MKVQCLNNFIFVPNYTGENTVCKFASFLNNSIVKLRELDAFENIKYLAMYWNSTSLLKSENIF